MERSFIHVPTSRSSDGDGFRSGRFTLRPERNAQDPKGDIAELIYEVASVRYEPMGVFIVVSEHTSAIDADYTYDVITRIEFGVETFTFRCLTTGLEAEGERWHKKSETDKGIMKERSDLSRVRDAETLEILHEAPDCEDRVEFTFSFPSERKTEIGHYSWVLYDESTFEEMHRTEVNAALAPGKCFSTIESTRVGSSSSKSNYYTTVFHAEGTAVCGPKTYEKRKAEHFAPKGNRIVFQNNYTWGSREEYRKCLIIDNQIWNEEEGDLGVTILSKENAGTGRKCYERFDLIIPEGKRHRIEAWQDAIDAGAKEENELITQ